MRSLMVVVMVSLATGSSCKRGALPAGTNDSTATGSVAPAGTAVTDDAPGPCAEADRLGQEKRYADALRSYRATLARLPDELVCLYNAGLTSYLAKDFVAAEDFWKRLEKLSPGDWRVRAKLVQTYQALGRIEERNHERSALFALRESTKDPELRQRASYCREQFEVDGRRVMADELFELKGKRARRYSFGVLDAGEKEDFRISLGSYEETDAFAHETGQVQKGERLFHLDGYYKDGSHQTFGMFKVEPTYEETRDLVIRAIQGKLRPTSGTSPRR